MSSLSAEVLDHVVDFLHDSTKVLKSCCLVSKSWVPRSRRHIFASVAFRTPVDLDSWKETFQDSSTSPAFYTKNLHVGCPDIVTAADAEEGGWIRTFCRVVWFEVEVSETDSGEWTVSFFPFHGFSPAVRSLVVTSTVLSASNTLNLVYSFPLLEDLTVNTYDESDDDDSPDEQPVIIQPLNPPAFTGSLNIFIDREMEPIVSPLLSLPGTLCFREIKLHWKDERDVSMTAMLAEKCCATLESLSISCSLSGTFTWHFSPCRWLTLLQTSCQVHLTCRKLQNSNPSRSLTVAIRSGLPRYSEPSHATTKIFGRS